MSEASLGDEDSDLEAPDTRTRLLDAAIHIASTQGLDKVTYRSVATQAGLSHSLVRFYFGSGEAMITAALERAAQLDVEESHIRAATIEEFGVDLLDVMGGERNRGMLQYDYLLRAVRRGVPLDRLVTLYDFYIGQVAGTLDDLDIDDPDGSIAAMILGAVDGLIMQHAIYESDERTERTLDRIRDLLRLLKNSSSGR
ncbi:TetR/AcrR family transcriptional regulator [Gordonia aichiensis]|uniref:Putative TetR family transcriptional regulator n=1 Tax=Gordonia aichiensis NBRC 108223 TaxID=1220583 RepID=L7KQ42_9ACTN|nr:TetR family transcriptional regulator [Gordonia aichiensis]GAC50749.1 putative TetR family transcriptional regulator [Gordonia aichiensis NBRC 108223]